MSRALGYCVFTFEGGDWSTDNFDGLDRGFAAAKELGYSYVEVPSYVYSGGPSRSDFQFLHRAGRIVALSERHQLPLSAIFAATDLLDESKREQEADHLVVLARLASTLGIEIVPVTLSMLRQSAGVAEAQLLGELLSEVGRKTLASGVRLAAHPHIDCPLETPAQIEAFCESSDPEAVSLCLDTGHVLAGGGDPAQLARDYAERIEYVHFKDLDASAYRRAEGRAKYEAFRDPGKGDVDFASVLDALTEHGYSGPILAENDLSPDPRGSMERAYDYLRNDLGL